jgi:hypothetical protein
VGEGKQLNTLAVEKFEKFSNEMEQESGGPHLLLSRLHHVTLSTGNWKIQRNIFVLVIVMCCSLDNEEVRSAGYVMTMRAVLSATLMFDLIT